MNESKKYRSKVEGRVRKAERARVEAKDELAREKQMYDSAFSQATSKLNKAETELAAMRGDLEQARKRAEATEQEVKQLKVNIEVRVAKEHKEVKFDICSAFVFTLWKAHPDLDFSYFGEEVVEAVKKYVVDATNSRVVATKPEPNQTLVDFFAEDAGNLAPQDAATPSSTSLGH
ncbi:uncharacterized protein LOC127805003 [Diospyros lotus]|uniref:uncharacterized protein LOC127805003 n=1 Tax=Diospyros lotus TaxID=55363 RepID=UPI002256593D|nr:uncharacterized protein LOC127805003 [Diospyros lotus]